MTAGDRYGGGEDSSRRDGGIDTVQSTDESGPVVTAHTSANDRIVFIESDNERAWIETDHTVAVER
jgi:hypothetical protein